MSLSTKWAWIVQDFPEGSDARTMMGEYEARIADLEADLREVRATEAAQRELANANMFLVKQQAERVSFLEAQLKQDACDRDAVHRPLFSQQIFELKAENARLREALEEIANRPWQPSWVSPPPDKNWFRTVALKALQSRQETDPMQNKNPLAAVRGWPTEKYSAPVPEPIESEGHQCPKPGHRMHEGNCVTCYTEQDAVEIKASGATILNGCLKELHAEGPAPGSTAKQDCPACEGCGRGRRSDGATAHWLCNYCQGKGYK